MAGLAAMAAVAEKPRPARSENRQWKDFGIDSVDGWHHELRTSPTGTTVVMSTSSDGRSSYVVVHDIDPIGTRIHRAAAGPTPLAGIAGLVEMPVTDHDDRPMADLIIRAIAADLISLDETEAFVSACVEWPVEDCVVSASRKSSDDHAPTPTPLLIAMLGELGPRSRLSPSATKLVFSDMFPGAQPEWGEGAVDGVSLDSSLEIELDMSDPIERLRLTVDVFEARRTLGLEAGQLMAAPYP